jgi:hypothetical protein
LLSPQQDFGKNFHLFLRIVIGYKLSNRLILAIEYKNVASNTLNLASTSDSGISLPDGSYNLSGQATGTAFHPSIGVKKTHPGRKSSPLCDRLGTLKSKQTGKMLL